MMRRGLILYTAGLHLLYYSMCDLVWVFHAAVLTWNSVIYNMKYNWLYVAYNWHWIFIFHVAMVTKIRALKLWLTVHLLFINHNTHIRGTLHSASISWRHIVEQWFQSTFPYPTICLHVMFCWWRWMCILLLQSLLLSWVTLGVVSQYIFTVFMINIF